MHELDEGEEAAAAAWDALAELWRCERAAARRRAAEERRAIPLKERVERGLALEGLEVADMDPAPGERTLVWLTPRKPEQLERLRAGVGDPVRLWQQDPEEPGAVRGVLARRRAGRLAVMLGSDEADELPDGLFRLDRDEDDATFHRGERALERFRGAPRGSDAARLGAILRGAKSPAAAVPPAWTPLDPELDASQREAVGRALGAPDLALIHGPPGTGKTRTLVEVIRQAVGRGERVLASAASNAAVDNLAERLAALGVDVLRLGHPARVAPAVEEHTLDARLTGSEGFRMAKRWQQEALAIQRRADKRRERGRGNWEERRAELAEARALFRDARRQLRAQQEALLDQAQVICATAAGADSQLLGPRTFDLVVLDEATQATDPVALVALGRAKRAVLAGDPCQLPPTVLDPQAARDGLGTTWFERLARRQADAVRLLTVQYRMHATLMDYPSRSLYEGQLEAAPQVAGQLLEDLGVAPDPLRPGPLLFLDTAGKGWQEERGGDDPSTKNPGQARRVVAEVRRLLGRGLAPGDLAVITPYDAQVRLLRDLLATERAAGLEIGSIDGFQGREKEAVLLDLVRANDEARLGFLEDIRRLNVAITRARRLLVVVGDSATVGGHEFYAGFIAAAEAAGGYLSAWNDEAPAFAAEVASDP